MHPLALNRHEPKKDSSDLEGHGHLPHASVSATGSFAGSQRCWEGWTQGCSP
jgi:hypothetical protein